MDVNIGMMLDNRYELLELIGTGGMANVYKAKCHRLNRLVAVKILKSDLAQNEEFRRRFRDESTAVAQLSHSNIVSVYDVSSFNGIEYIVMELIDGITLKQYIERRGKMDWRESLHFITQIIRGLSHAHSRGIIHRDIKPQNIMVLRDGSVKVADFGIACLANNGETVSKEAFGSVHYISPEQARGDRVDERSDIYSAGVVLYEMLTGHLPFEGDSAISVAIQHLSSVPALPSDLNNEIPSGLESICMKAMSPDLNKRYDSADAMLRDLEKFKKDPSINLDYIRNGTFANESESQPTQDIPVGDITAAIKKDKKNDKKRNRNNRQLFIIVGIVAAIVVIIIIFKIIFSGFSSTPTGTSYAVPNVIGYTVEEAYQLKGISGIFEIEVVGTKTSDKYTEGEIVEQNPTEGHTRKSNLTIQVYVCAKSEDISMPDLISKNYQEAKIILNQLDLKLEVEMEEMFSDTYSVGQVIETFPTQGTSLNKGETVTMIVSKGAEIITVADYTGMTLTMAIENAKNSGLNVGESIYQYSAYPEGVVFDQSLTVGNKVESGSSIVFSVSGSGPTNQSNVKVMFTMPDEIEMNTSVRVEFVLNDTIVATEFFDGSQAIIEYSFSGPVGSNASVYANINGKPTDRQEIIF